MVGTQYEVKWSDHSSQVFSQLRHLLEKEILVDVTLMCNEKSLKVHKLMLAACSPYFQHVLQRELGDHPLIVLKDMQFSVLKSIVEFMYFGETVVFEDDFNSLIEAAKFFEIKGLSKMSIPKNGNKDKISPFTSDNICIVSGYSSTNKMGIGTCMTSSPESINFNSNSSDCTASGSLMYKNEENALLLSNGNNGSNNNVKVGSRSGENSQSQLAEGASDIDYQSVPVSAVTPATSSIAAVVPNTNSAVLPYPDELSAKILLSFSESAVRSSSRLSSTSSNATLQDDAIFQQPPRSASNLLEINNDGASSDSLDENNSTSQFSDSGYKSDSIASSLDSFTNVILSASSSCSGTESPVSLGFRLSRSSPLKQRSPIPPCNTNTSTAATSTDVGRYPNFRSLFDSIADDKTSPKEDANDIEGSASADDSPLLVSLLTKDGFNNVRNKSYEGCIVSSSTSSEIDKCILTPLVDNLSCDKRTTGIASKLPANGISSSTLRYPAEATTISGISVDNVTDTCGREFAFNVGTIEIIESIDLNDAEVISLTNEMQQKHLSAAVRKNNNTAASLNLYKQCNNGENSCATEVKKFILQHGARSKSLIGGTGDDIVECIDLNDAEVISLTSDMQQKQSPIRSINKIGGGAITSAPGCFQTIESTMFKQLSGEERGAGADADVNKFILENSCRSISSLEEADDPESVVLYRKNAEGVMEKYVISPQQIEYLRAINEHCRNRVKNNDDQQHRCAKPESRITVSELKVTDGDATQTANDPRPLNTCIIDYKCSPKHTIDNIIFNKLPFRRIDSGTLLTDRQCADDDDILFDMRAKHHTATPTDSLISGAQHQHHHHHRQHHHHHHHHHSTDHLSHENMLEELDREFPPNSESPLDDYDSRSANDGDLCRTLYSSQSIKDVDEKCIMIEEDSCDLDLMMETRAAAASITLGGRQSAGSVVVEDGLAADDKDVYGACNDDHLLLDHHGRRSSDDDDLVFRNDDESSYHVMDDCVADHLIDHEYLFFRNRPESHDQRSPAALVADHLFRKRGNNGCDNGKRINNNHNSSDEDDNNDNVNDTSIISDMISRSNVLISSGIAVSREQLLDDDKDEPATGTAATVVMLGSSSSSSSPESESPRSSAATATVDLFANTINSLDENAVFNFKFSNSSSLNNNDIAKSSSSCGYLSGPFSVLSSNKRKPLDEVYIDNFKRLKGTGVSSFELENEINLIEEIVLD